MGSLTAGRKIRPSELQMSVSRYYSTDSTSSIVNGGADLTLQWATADNTHANVTPSGTGNTTFTLNKTGIWIIEAEQRCTFGTVPSSGDLNLYMILVSGAVQIAWQTFPNPIYGACLPNVCTVRSFNSGDQVQVKLSNGTNQTVTLGNGSFAFFSSISLTWLQGP